MTSPAASGQALLAQVLRGGEVESSHSGAVAVVDARGRLLHHTGDPHGLTFTRSTLKPFQAMPFVHAGGLERFGYTEAEAALLCASHFGEGKHVQAAQRMLSQAGCGEHHLQCGCHEPLHFGIEGKRPHAGEVFSQLHNNCSGKHAGFLAWCMLHGQPLDSYLDPSHPLQVAVRGSAAHFAGLAEADLRAGIDGCSAPNYAMPLASLALAYARLAQDDPDPAYGEAPRRLFAAMTSHPDMVSGNGRSDLAFMRTAPGDWVAKAGAEGVQALGIRSAGLGIAIKIADGNARALAVVMVDVLRQLGLLSKVEGTPLEAWARPEIRNLRGLPTGAIMPAVQLMKA
ncbi:asparaginase [Noviherbaspirillum humi]|uniref:Asparaginase n=1 Tax=Noviherbaspirillum humi TaxID=1688639 RepID=A0A239CI26_9BURK|nr:asparaginase [Noviherbaspirillum humi]SNS19572.1 asparaginase [Noviherbaspirillum humi]